MNLSFVAFSLLLYPLPNPSPATYSSPGFPIGQIFLSLSNIYILVLFIGLPIVILSKLVTFLIVQ